MICLCINKCIVNTDIVLLLTASLICCCSSLLKGFSLFNYIKCSKARDTNMTMGFLGIISIYCCLSARGGEKKTDAQMFSSNNSQKEFLSPSG